MLWRLRRPLTQTLRITTAGISRQNPDGTWRPSANANGQESRLFLALLAGDATGLSEISTWTWQAARKTGA